MSLTDEERAELEQLRARVRELERERAAEHARAAALMADAQDRTYWLDRWHVDLNKLVDTPNGARFRAAIRAARGPIRRTRLAKRRLDDYKRKFLG